MLPMSGAAPIESHAPLSARPGPSWHVRAATRDDVPAVAAAVRELLLELGSTPPSIPAMETTARALLDDRGAGALLVAEARGAIVGVLGASVQIAIHVPGRYALIQDLWVHPSWRSMAIGGALIAALCELAREQRLARIEVGLPREHSAQILATEAFYVRNGFEPLGARMRRVLS
jgi:branched-chain amino acid aminotransferase